MKKYLSHFSKGLLILFLICLSGAASFVPISVFAIGAPPAPGGGAGVGGIPAPPVPGAGAGTGGGQVVIGNPLNVDTFEELIGNIINFIFNFALVFAPLMFIVAGFLFITASGDPEKIKTAKTVIWYTLIGLVIVMLAKGIIKVIEEIMEA